MTDLTGLVRGATDSVGSITPIASIAALRALTTPTGPDSPQIVEVDGWATAGDSYQGKFKCVGPGTTASFTATFQIFEYDGARSWYQLTVSNVVGTISIGDTISGTNIISGTLFTSQQSGTTGGAGVYNTNYLPNISPVTPAALTSSSDNGATQFMDASGRLWLRLWDKNIFHAEWVGIFASNADNGPMIGRIPKGVRCYAPGWKVAQHPDIATTGRLTFLTYPTQAQFSNIIWIGFGTIFSCAGSLGAASPTAYQPGLDQIAFDWTYNPPNDIFFAGSPAVATGYDMTGTGISGFENIAIFNKLDITFGVGLRLGSAAMALLPIAGTDLTPTLAFLPWSHNTYMNNLMSRPAKVAIAGFYINHVLGAPNLHTFCTGLDSYFLKNGNYGIYYAQNAPNSYDSGENMLYTRGTVTAMTADAIIVQFGQAWTFANLSSDYNHRSGHFSSSCVMNVDVYHETNETSTPGELYFVEGGSNITFNDTTTFLGLPYPWASLINMGANWAAGDNPQVQFNSCQYYDTAWVNTLTGNFQVLRQFVSGQDFGIYGSLRGFNGINHIQALSPAQLLQPDYNFASGGLTMYPGSTGCAVQTAVVPVTATHAVLMTNTASLNFGKMSVTPGRTILMTFVDQLSGTLTALGGSMNFYTEDDILISTAAIDESCKIPNFYGAHGGVAPYGQLAALFNTTPRAVWTVQPFAFRVPAGASKMSGNIATTGTSSLYYIANIAIYGEDING